MLISDTDAIAVARLLNQKGLSVGISSGANLLAATMKANELGTEAVVATILCDDNKKYISTDLFSDTEEELSFQLKILDYTIMS